MERPPHVEGIELNTRGLKVRVWSSEKKADTAKPKGKVKIRFISFWKRKLSTLRFQL